MTSYHTRMEESFEWEEEKNQENQAQHGVSLKKPNMRLKTYTAWLSKLKTTVQRKHAGFVLAQQKQGLSLCASPTTTVL